MVIALLPPAAMLKGKVSAGLEVTANRELELVMPCTVKVPLPVLVIVVLTLTDSAVNEGKDTGVTPMIRVMALT